MGFWDTITDLVEAAAPWSTAEAEAPPAEDKVWETHIHLPPSPMGIICICRAGLYRHI